MKRQKINIKKTILYFVLIALFPGLATVLAGSPSVINITHFSAEKVSRLVPTHWEPFYFKDIKRHSVYRLVEEDGQVVVKAEANASASGLMRKISINPREYPIIQWRWKVTNILKKGNVHRKEGDDYPARVFVLFEYGSGRLGFSDNVKYEIAKMLYGEYPPLAILNYIWSSSAPLGLVVANPYTDRSMMVVVESGEKNLNAWVSEERNIYADYREAFNDEPPMITGVAIMTDADNTGESATAFYGDILFRKK